jgi:hypothetical protein
VVFPFFEQQILHLFNFVFLTGVYPENWKVSRVIPVPKKSPCLSVSDYRPISILPVLSKVFEALAKEQILGHVGVCDLLTPYQSGYRAGHSATTAVLSVVDDLGVRMDRGEVSVLVLLDFSKAFDCLDHARLCSKLRGQFGFDGAAFSLLQSYLQGRRQVVCVNGACSAVGVVSSGVPQGSILGPILFSLFVHDVHEVFSFCKFHMFADDLQFYNSSSVSDLRRLETEVNSDLLSVVAWSRNNGLSLNVGKTQVLFVRRPLTLVNEPCLFLDGSELSFVSSVTNLGFFMGSDLNWNGLASRISGRVAATLGRLRSFGRLSTSVKLRLFKTLVLPFFNYGDVFLLSLSEEYKRVLNKSLNDCVRFVYSLRLGDHVTSYQRNLIGCPFARYYEFRAVLFIHRLLLTRCPGYLYDRLSLSTSRRTRRLVTPRNRTALYNGSFFVQGVRAYNALPDPIKLLANLTAFRKECLGFYNE